MLGCNRKRFINLLPNFEQQSDYITAMPYFGEIRSYPDLKIFNDAILAEIQHFASRGLTREEIAEGYSIDLDNLPPADLSAFNEHYNYGRVQGLKAMSDSLFMQAKARGGTPAALAYLLRFGANFPPLNDGASATITLRDETGANIVPDSKVKIT